MKLKRENGQKHKVNFASCHINDCRNLFLNFFTGEKFSISENVNLSSFSFSQKDKFSFNIKEFLKFNPITFFDNKPVDASHKAQPLTL